MIVTLMADFFVTEVSFENLLRAPYLLPVLDKNVYLLENHTSDSRHFYVKAGSH